MLVDAALPDSVDLVALKRACRSDLKDQHLWFAPGGYPKSLALCIIDAIYSTGGSYSSVVKIVERYRRHRTERGGDPDTDGIDELADTFAELGGPDEWATHIGDRRPASGKAGAPLKAAVISALAISLPAHGVRNTGDLMLVAAQPETLRVIERLWRRSPGQQSGITWTYALMLAAVPGARADRMVIKYVARAIGVRPAAFAPDTVANLLRHVASARGWDAAHLDHAIWRHECERSFRNTDGQKTYRTAPV